MRLLLVQDTVWVPGWGGANKLNRLVMEELALRGHECRAITPSCGSQASASDEAFHAELARRGITFHVQPDADIFVFNSVTVSAFRDKGCAETCITELIREFAPAWVLVASEDAGQLLLSMVLKQTSRVIYLARTTLALPFGPSCAIPSQAGTALLRRVAGIVVVSEYLQDYFRRWAGLESSIVPISPSDPAPFPHLGNFDNDFVTMINPCLYKGLPIFIELAKAMPDLKFAAVPTWGTTQEDVEQLRQIRNITLLHPRDEVAEIFQCTRVLLFPSLWAEAKGMVVIEAMIHGIPVIASAVGGIPEAKLGIDYLIPVAPIVAFTEELDERMLPIPHIPKQDLQPWIEALRALTSNRTLYNKLSGDSRKAALIATEAENIGVFEEYLEELRQKEDKGRNAWVNV